MAFNRLNRWFGYGGLARDGWRSLRAQPERQRQAQSHLAERLGKLRGLPQKIGQMLSLSAEEETAESFAKLRENATPLPWSQIKPILKQAWGCEPCEFTAWCDPIGKAASLGQVHRAELCAGTNVAIKVQYPGMRAAIATDLQALGWLSLPLGGLKRGFDLAGYQQELLANLENELDYRREAAQQEACRRAWADLSEEVVVPRVFHDLTSENVLVTEWQEGATFAEVLNRWPLAAKESLAKLLVRWWLHSIWRGGCLQTDLHPGNLRFRRTVNQVQLVAFDFGSIVQVSAAQQQGLVDLIAAVEDHPTRLLADFSQLGFDYEKLQPLEAKLPDLARLLFAPFLTSQPFSLADWRLSEQMQEILGNDRWNFRLAGPPSLLAFIRSLQGLIYYLQKLPAVNWRQPFQTLAPAPTPTSPLPMLNEPIYAAQLADAAEHLKIRVAQEGEVKVQLTFPATAVERLADLMGDDLVARIRAQGIALEAIAKQVQTNHYQPGLLFELTADNKQAAVWLE